MTMSISFAKHLGISMFILLLHMGKSWWTYVPNSPGNWRSFRSFMSADNFIVKLKESPTYLLNKRVLNKVVDANYHFLVLLLAIPLYI